MTPAPAPMHAERPQVRGRSGGHDRSGSSGRKRRRARARPPRVPQLGELLVSAQQSLDQAPHLQPGSGPPAFDFSQLRIHADAEDAQEPRIERLDPATQAIRLATDVLRSLRGDPEDRSQRVQLQLARIDDPGLSSAVMAKLHVWLPSSEYGRVVGLVAEANADAAPLPLQSRLYPQPVEEPDPQGDQVKVDDTWVSDATNLAQLQAERMPWAAQTRAEQATAAAEKSANAADADQQKASAGRAREGTAASERAVAARSGQAATADHQQQDALAAALRARQAQAMGGEQGQQRAQADRGREQRSGATQREAAVKREGGPAVVPARPVPQTGAMPTVPMTAGSGGTPPIALDRVDALANAPDGPLARHQMRDTPGNTAEQQPDQAPPGEEPIGAESADLPEIDLPEPALPEPQTLARPAEAAARPEPVSPRLPATEPVPLEVAATEPEAPASPAPSVERQAAPAPEAATSLQAATQAELPSQSSSDAPESLDPQSLNPPATTEPATGSPAGPAGSESLADDTAAAPDVAPDSVGPAAVAPADPGAAGPGPAAAAPGALPADASVEAGGGSCAGGPEASTDLASGGGGPAGGGGAPAGGGSAAPPPQPAVPDVSRQQPQAALAVVGQLPAVPMARGLGGVTASVGHSVGQQRDALAKSPPELERPSGAPRTLHGLPPVAPAASYGSDKVQKAAAQGPGQQAKPQGKQVAGGPTPADQVPAPKVTGNAKGDATTTDVKNVQQAVNNVPTTDPVLDHASVGVAPRVQLTGQANPALTGTQLTNLRDRAARILTTGRDDATRPLGEDQIYPDVPHEILKASVPKGGAAGPSATAAVVDSGPAGDQAVSAVAQQERGPQISSAIAQGQAKMAAGEQARQHQEVQDRQQHHAQVAAAIKKSTDDETAERGKVAVQVGRQRSAWQDQESKLATDADTQAGQKHDKARSDVEKKKSDADTEIDKRQRSDNTKITVKRREAEAKARSEQAKKQTQSGGWFGWVCSKISQAFSALISLVKGIFDAARKFVQGVINEFKSFVTGLIDLARKAIIGLIVLYASVVLAIGDTLLAAFPALRDKFRKLIIGLRNAAIALVNKVANFLKSAITSLLNLLAKGLNALLNLLQQQLLAAIKSVQNTIQGVINFVKNAIAILGEFAAIVRDVAADPGGWIRKLGSAIVDGIRYYLWDAIKTAVKNWFTGQIQQILGLGQLITGGEQLLSVLRKGCITIGKIVQMAWQAMISALPSMLIQLVIQRLVAFLVPALGGIITIVQSVIAAYNTISSIITAISRFVAFLKAVKSGTAARPFAQAVAAGAVALLAFIANWLLGKLKGAAKGIGSKLKGIAQKILAFLKRGAKTVRKGIGTVFNLAKKGARAAVGAIRRGFQTAVRLARRVLARLPGLVKRGLRLVAAGIRALGRRLANTRLGKFLISLARKLRARYLAFKAKLAQWRNKVRAWLDKRKKEKEEEAESETEQPTVNVPFEMALVPHELVLAPVGDDVEVGSKSVYEDLRLRYEDVYNRIGYFKAYVESIEDPAVKASFESEILAKMEQLQATSPKAFKEAYENAFGKKGSESAELPAEKEEELSAKLEEIIGQCEAMLTSIMEWGDATGVTDLSGDAIEEVFDRKGPEIWNERFLEIKEQVDRIISGYRYKEEYTVGYVGSMVRGLRGRFKGRTNMDIDLFDVDMYVVDPEEFERVLPLVDADLVLAEGSVILPDPEHTPDLLRLSNQIQRELASKLGKLGVKNLSKITAPWPDGSLIGLRKEGPTP
jgi:phage-related protein